MKSFPITVESVRKAYGSYLALDGVSLEIEAGEFLTLLGPSGSGKTTLLMAVAGFVLLDNGKILLGGRDITRLPPNKRELGIVFQNYALFPHMNVLANVEYPLALRKIPRVDARRRALDALARVKLEGFAQRDIAALSGGQRQRVALARAIVFKPRVMLMDEPLSALDKNLREAMQYEIRRLHDDLGITTIYVTHDQREALTMSDRIAVMNSGRIEQIDTPERVYHRPLTRFVAEFMGEANIVPPGSVRRIDGVDALRETLMIRAESFHLDPAFAGPDGVALEGVLRAKSFRGENWLLTLELDTRQEVLISVPATLAAGCADLAPGQRVAAFAPAAKVHAIAGAKV
ncbi:ABC transporter ATP-binding protein [Mesorhizobium sp. M2E.F.Ca.ET.209.01.1.1]|uniref:ABC transporter ATP-binding protein n=1 Tax=Mesorhizobium sp. M2E.F.Ca.ET.209.01.1.1 TaxID=2500526 RepID=UPI000FD8CB91|nr:ABC transporter ATP-binding protein [Mesorhizobium sp. M2E.F.Ca.ET.209.01.1.1]TGS14296.1 ABC transporter ATP-binding protein [Mesorhizobium sp. M2E.F.Ca.ET.209.01.1.1]